MQLNHYSTRCSFKSWLGILDPHFQWNSRKSKFLARSTERCFVWLAVDPLCACNILPPFLSLFFSTPVLLSKTRPTDWV